MLNWLAGLQAVLYARLVAITYHVEYNLAKLKLCVINAAVRCINATMIKETVKKRLEVYHSQTTPLIEYYKQ